MVFVKDLKSRRGCAVLKRIELKKTSTLVVALFETNVAPRRTNVWLKPANLEQAPSPRIAKLVRKSTRNSRSGL